MIYVARSGNEEVAFSAADELPVDELRSLVIREFLNRDLHMGDTIQVSKVLSEEVVTETVTEMFLSQSSCFRYEFHSNDPGMVVSSLVRFLPSRTVACFSPPKE